ncbi:LexA family protein [Candidatus Nitrotoga sp. 1052]|uniref:LexA family protein n=1 Tax=Candidatus Nitrotoga sp. 1052 TaxID=2886964 RepID=UPI001EF43CE6|nr:translesion error-prone DNA polymerase V autoproteolytic subunit [Candidatus Nitrotoga sp. 1052]CAH1073317.1 Error-prone repair protein UmuD [Candidatus Nitrotoga sp. 1052]
MKQTNSKSSTRGGTRPGAGRKVGSSPYGENTKLMRIPESIVETVGGILAACKAQRLGARFKNDILYPALDSQPIRVPLFSHKVPAGFPSPADDYIEARLSLDQHLITNKDATFFVRAKGNSMIDAGIFDGDLLVVDKSLTPSSGNIVIAIIDGDLTVKRLILRDNKTILKPENPRFKEIELKDGQELQVWGVVTSTVKKFI